MIQRIAFLFFTFFFTSVVKAQERCGSILADWLSCTPLRNELGVTRDQETQILTMVKTLRLEYHKFLDGYPLPISDGEGPRAGLIADGQSAFVIFRNKKLAEFESELMTVLDPDQGDRLLGRLVHSAGPRSMIQSPELRRQLKLSDKQIRTLEVIFIEQDEKWQDMMHEGDKLQFVDTAQEMEAKMSDYAKRRQRLMAERIWKVREMIDKVEVEMDEMAIRVMTPDQKLLYDHFETKWVEFEKSNKKTDRGR